MRAWGATPEPHIFWHFKHLHPGYPKTLWRTDVVHLYACLERHAKTPRFLALRSANIPVLGIQKHFGGQIWCRGVRTWSATTNPHIFWHCAFQTPPSWVFKNTLPGRFGTEVCTLGAPLQNSTFFGIGHFKHPHTSYPKKTFAGRFGAEVCALGAPRQKPRIFSITYFKHPHTRYPKTLFLADSVLRYARLEHHAKNSHFLALRISNTPVLGIQKPSFWQIWCRGMRA